MSKIRDMITGASSTESLVIEQQLANLFFAPMNPKEELAMLKMQCDISSKDRYGLHASAIIAPPAEFCYREQVLSLFYKQAQGENISPGLKRIFQEGTSIGEKWQRLFIRGGIGKKEDMDISRFCDAYDLSYTPDGIIEVAKKKYIVEIKSQNTFIFKKQAGHPSGMKQLKMYMWLEQIHNGFVLVEDKNDQNFKVLMGKHNEADISDFIERLEQIQVYKKRFKKHKKPPERICNSHDCKRAQKCNMKDACFNVGMGRIKL